MLTQSLFSTMFLAFVIRLRLSSAFINGFPKEQCDAMDPSKLTLDNTSMPQDYSDYNASAELSSEEPPTSVQLSSRYNLFRIVTSSPKYRRGKVLDITIRGPEFNAMMLQVRKIGPDERRGYDKPVRVGEFRSWPSSLQPVMCEKGKATALTNKNFAPKSDITVKWKAPKEDVGEIHVAGRFIVGDEYWPITESREIPLNEFPVNLANCGKAKSCILYSEGVKSCHEDNCDYILTYRVINNTNVEFVLGGKSKGEQTYLAVGFSKSKEGDAMKLVACTRAKTVAEIKYYIVQNAAEGPLEHPMHLENQKMDLDGDRMWCSFTMPLVTQGDESNGLDLSAPLYQVYLRGNTNYTKTANHPLLPSKLFMSKKELLVEKMSVQHHMIQKKSSATSLCTTGVFMAMLISLLVPLL